MSGLTQNTLARIDKWLSYGTSMQTAFPKLEQRYRMQVCSEFYKRWVQNRDIDPRTVCRNIARRDYEMFFNQAAQGNKEAQEYVLALKITLDDEGNICPRTVTELNNDVLVCNHLIRFFQTDESPRHKAMYLSSAEWLIRTGKQQNNDRAVDKGMQALANVYGNFQEEKDATDEMPDMSRVAITQDVSIVKRDRVNYTEEEKRRMARKYGLTTKDLQEIEDDEMFSDKREEEPDYFEYMEMESEEGKTKSEESNSYKNSTEYGKAAKKNKMKCLIDKVVKGEIFTFQEEVEYQGRNTYLHRLNEKIQWYAHYRDPTPFIAEIRNGGKVILTPLFDAHGRYDIFGTNGEKEGEVNIPLDEFLLRHFVLVAIRVKRTTN